MKKLLTIIILLSLFSCKENIIKDVFDYPETKKVDQVDDYFGTMVSDPYRWLENDTSAETSEWVNIQNELTRSYLDSLPYREKIQNRLTELWNYPKQGITSKAGDNYFFYKNDGLDYSQARSIEVHIKK